jgi:hypothetical protein
MRAYRVPGGEVLLVWRSRYIDIGIYIDTSIDIGIDISISIGIVRRG